MRGHRGLTLVEVLTATVLMAILVAFVVLVYLVSLVRMGGG